MSDVVIRAEKLAKRYQIGERESYLALRDVFARAVSVPARIFRSRKPQSTNGDATHIWALKDVSFEVRLGEIVGIIGGNGAGKSTLLKILARVTKPTRGFAVVRGRVGSLLEVGTGFHPELTGRENTYLNGAILGMSKSEIDRKFDEIVAFAELEKFLDTPVKHYSTGMYMRLAFAVAAHLEPEILIVDEVLAVGDMQFQKKCLGKMGQVSREGRTVLFVSHNMAAVNTLCRRAALLDAGKIQAMGATTDVIDLYTQTSRERFGTYYEATQTDQVGDSSVRLRRTRIVNENFETLDRALITQRIGIEISYEILDSRSRPVPNIYICTADGQSVFLSIPATSNFSVGRHTAVVWIPGNTLNDRQYVVWIGLTSMNPVFIHLLHEIHLTVIDNLNAPTRGDYMGTMQGVVRPLLEWQQQIE
jgi:lipopolysaccharide transport system ATP-binding protein